MTLKEAQDLLSSWIELHPGEESMVLTSHVDRLLEAARVVERSKFIQIIDDHSKSKTVLCETGEKHVCSSICLDFIKEILSDNQDNNEGN